VPVLVAGPDVAQEDVAQAVEQCGAKQIGREARVDSQGDAIVARGDDQYDRALGRPGEERDFGSCLQRDHVETNKGHPLADQGPENGKRGRGGLDEVAEGIADVGENPGRIVRLSGRGRALLFWRSS
jgi:hypothetical protein